tara:strand:+ start:1524 stop:2144 length:621 start_codon:yes stop_codon:yes gene_type:complete
LRKLAYSRGDTNRSFEEVYRLLQELYEKTDGIDYGFNKTTGKAHLRIKTKKGWYETFTDGFQLSGNSPGTLLSDTIGSADLIAPSIPSKAAGTVTYGIPADFGVAVYNFKITVGDTTANILSIPAGYLLEGIGVVVTTLFDNAATITFSDGVTLMPTSAIDLTATGHVDHPVWKHYTSADTLAYTLANSPTVGVMRVFVKLLKVTK